MGAEGAGLRIGAVGRGGGAGAAGGSWPWPCIWAAAGVACIGSLARPEPVLAAARVASAGIAGLGGAGCGGGGAGPNIT